MYLAPSIMGQDKKLRHENRILAALPSDDYERLVPHLQNVSFGLGDILYMPEETIEYIYFPTTSLVSLLAVLDGGETVEAGVVGFEGVVGVPVILGVQTGTTQALVQGAGEALSMKASALKPFIENGGPLHDLLLLYTHTMFTQIAQTAGCNRAHDLGQRLARWLLLTHDRLRRDKFELTHVFLAKMLGTRRAGVTVAAKLLKQGGMIDYSRGQVHILNRQKLEEASCECYRIVKAEFDRVFND